MSVNGKYVTAFTGGVPISGFKNVGNVAIDINPGAGDYSLGNFVGGVESSYDDNSYIIISDTTTALLDTRSTGAHTGFASPNQPTFFASKFKTDESFLRMVNRLPERANQTPFTDPFEASTWLRLNRYWTTYPTPLLSLDAVNYTSGNWVDSIGSKNFQLYNAPTLGTLNASLSFDGGSQYLYTNNAVFIFGTADFTIEMWWYPTINHRSDVLDFWNNTGSRLIFGASILTGNLELYTDNPGIGGSTKITGPSTSTLINSWNHISLTRESGSIKMWLNGTQVGSTYNSNVLDFTDSMNLNIMCDHIAGPNGGGYLSNVRVVTGTAVYTSTFTPPTNSLEDIPGTQLLLNTKQVSNFLQDSSMNNLIFGNEGSVNIVLDTPLEENYYFNFDAGSSQYAQSSTSLPDLSHWSVGVWHYYTDTNVGPGACILTETYTSGSINFSLGDNDTVLLSGGFFDGSWRTSGTYILTPNNWYYIVGTYDGSSINLYIDNNLVQSSSYNGIPISSQSGIRLMSRWDSNSYWGGKLAKVDIYDGALSLTQIDSIWNSTKSRFGFSKSRFTLSSSDFATFYNYGNGVTPLSNTGFSTVGQYGPGEEFYGTNLALDQGGSSAKLNEIRNLWVSNGLSANTGAYMFNVTWGPGSTLSSGVVIIGFYDYGDNSTFLQMGVVDTSDPTWQTSSTGYYNGPIYTLAGTWKFPATFTLIEPKIVNGQDWC